MDTVSFYKYAEATDTGYEQNPFAQRSPYQIENNIDIPDGSCTGLAFLTWEPPVYTNRDAIFNTLAIDLDVEGETEVQTSDLESKITKKEDIEVTEQGNIIRTWTGTCGHISIVVKCSDYDTFSLASLTSNATEIDENSIVQISKYAFQFQETVTDDNSSSGSGDESSPITRTNTITLIPRNYGIENGENDNVNVYAVYSTAGNATIYFSYQDSDGAIKEWGTSQSVSIGTAWSNVTVPTNIKSRTTGFWAYAGSTKPTTGEVSSDFTVFAEYKSATKTIALYQDESESAYSTITLTWGALYPTLVSIPTSSSGKFLEGIYLTKNDGTGDSIKCYNSKGNPIALVNLEQLGTITYHSEDYTPAAVEGYRLVAKYADSISPIFTNIDELRQKAGIIPTPFASDPSACVDIDDSDASDVEINFTTGFPDSYCTPIIDKSTGEINASARVITRRQVNTLGNLGSQDQFFEQCGGYYTYDEEISKAIGGYPENAILKFYDEDEGSLRVVRSLKDNNDKNFVEDKSWIDNVHWAYVDDNPILRMAVDYEEYIDLSNTIFIETGIQDLYEIPYDSFLQFYSIFSLDCSCLTHPDSENVNVIWEHDDKGNQILEPVNGMFFVPTGVLGYIDVYNNPETRYTSIPISIVPVWNWYASASAYYKASNGEVYKKSLNHFEVLSPLCAAIGSLMLSKGDKIRVRNLGINGTVRYSSARAVKQLQFTDQKLKKIFQVKFANLYKRRWQQ